jgi:FkbM family methyltransferase
MGMTERQVTIGEHSFLLSSDDTYLDQMGNPFEPQMVDLFRALTRPTDRCLDIGANIGCTTLLFSHLVREVLAFEPSPTTFALLERNLNRAAVDNVRLVNAGLGAVAGRSQLTFSPDNRAGGYVSDLTAASMGHTCETIEIRRLDEVDGEMGLEPVDFVKIDVEGFEGHVLDGGMELLQRDRPVVVLELNHWCLNALQRTSVPEFFDHLRRIFPILRAVEGVTSRDLHDPSQSYQVMYLHINHLQFRNIVAAFDQERLAEFQRRYPLPG